MARNESPAANERKPSTNDPESVIGSEGEGEKAHGQDASDTESAPFSALHEVAFIWMICMAQFLALAGLAQSIAPIAIIGRSFGVTNEGELSWYPAAFSLTVGTFILPAGRLVR